MLCRTLTAGAQSTDATSFERPRVSLAVHQHSVVLTELNYLDPFVTVIFILQLFIV